MNTSNLFVPINWLGKLRIDRCEKIVNLNV